MITVLSGGDSFVWGSELADSPHGGPYGYSHRTFPALLADRYLCAAYPGIGNAEISKRVQDYLSHSTVDFVIVCWTWPTRDNTINSDLHIEHLQNYLEYNFVPYMFTCADNCVVTGKLNYDKWFLFPPGTRPDETNSPRGFYQWAIENKYPVGTDQHPLEQAHIDAAKLMKEKFNELVKTSLE